MQHAVSARTPAHLWIVGILSLVWNAYGAIDYLMTRLRNMAWLSQMGDPTEMLAYVNSMPIYAQVGWGLGVWSAVLGSLLLLIRSRWAALAFAVSLVGMAMSFSYMFLIEPMPAPADAGAMKYMPFVIVIAGIAQFYYAWRQQKSGVLR